MVSKTNESSKEYARPRAHGSSLHRQPTPLDQERAASMADEGGVSGAITDAREQEYEHSSHTELALRAQLSRARWLPWAFGAFAAVGAIFLVRLFRD